MLLCSLAAGCRPSGGEPGKDVPPPWFVDTTEEAGLRFQHDAGRIGDYFMPQIMGSGAALIDFDNDNLLDVYLLNNGGPQGARNRLFRQLPNRTFQDVTEGSGLDIRDYCMGVAVGDINNDGFPDLVVTGYGSIHLFQNTGRGSFIEITRRSGLASAQWGMSASFFDYDRDGWLDLVVVNYVDYDPARDCHEDDDWDYCGPNVFHGTITQLFHNETSAGKGKVRFQEVTVAAGLSRKPGPGLGVVCADFNGDSWPDVLVANDGKANHLWINARDGTFREEGVARALAYNGSGMAQGNMGIALADVDGDGLSDVFITHLTDETNTLWQQGPRGFFRDRTAAAGLASPGWRGTGFGTVLADFNHDGAVDLAVVNGRVLRGLGIDRSSYWEPYTERSQLFAGDGQGRFRDLSATDPFCLEPALARGLVCGDVDGDGALDLLVTRIGSPARLYHNLAGQQGHWLLVRAVDPVHKRDALGAVVTVHAGGRRLVSSITPGYSYLCSNDSRAHFGLGQADQVSSVRVRWPDGDNVEEVFPGGAADRVLVLHRGKGKRAAR